MFDLDKTEDHALAIASIGLKVFPLAPDSKRPVNRDYSLLASTNAEQIREWFKTYPSMNYGVICGDLVNVLDIDVKDGKDGLAFIKHLCGDDVLKNLASTLCIETPSGGFHYYLKPHPNAKTKHHSGGVDYQAGGSFVVGPGSIIGGKKYLVINGQHPTVSLDIRTLTLLGVDQKSSESVQLDTPVSLPLNESDYATSLLFKIDPDLPYDAWRDSVFAYFNLGGTEEVAEGWSQTGLKWGSDSFNKLVKSYDPNQEMKLGLPRLEEIKALYPACNIPLPVPTLDTQGMRQQACKASVEILSAFGSKISNDHQYCLEKITSTMVDGCYSNNSFRISYPLDTGMGKTTCIKALIKILENTDRTLLVCAEQIDQLEALRVDLIDLGVSSEKIGIYHSSKSHIDVVSIDASELANTQFLLATHSRIKSSTKKGDSAKLLWVSRGGQSVKRDLVVWDETMFTTEPIHIDRTELRDRISQWVHRYEANELGKLPVSVETQEDFLKLITKIDHELKRFSGEDFHQFRLNGIYDTKFPIRAYLPCAEKIADLNILIDFLSGNEETIQIKAQRKTLLAQFTCTVDDEFDKVVILDASAPLRKLIDYDQSIQTFNLPKIKDYSQVTIKHLDVRSSKSSTDDKKQYLNYCKEGEAILQAIPSDEHVLIFCFKNNLENTRQFFKDYNNVHVLNWGQHRARNDYAHVKHVIFIGVLYRDKAELASKILSQSKGKHKGNSTEIRNVEITEQADIIYQAISRGNSRVVTDGVAGTQTNYLILPKKEADDVLKLLKEHMKGLVVEPYKPNVLTSRSSEMEERIEMIRDVVFNKVKDKMSLVTFNKLPEILSIRDRSRRSWNRLLKEAIDGSNGFAIEDRSIVKTSVHSSYIE